MKTRRRFHLLAAAFLLLVASPGMQGMKAPDTDGLTKVLESAPELEPNPRYPYRIGYSSGMLEAAAYGDPALPHLEEIARSHKSTQVRLAAVYAGYFIGTGGEKQGRYVEHFDHDAARAILRRLLLEPELAPDVALLLKRDPHPGDVEWLFHALEKQEKPSWKTLNALNRWRLPGAPIDPPLSPSPNVNRVTVKIPPDAAHRAIARATLDAIAGVHPDFEYETGLPAEYAISCPYPAPGGPARTLSFPTVEKHLQTLKQLYPTYDFHEPGRAIWWARDEDGGLRAFGAQEARQRWLDWWHREGRLRWEQERPPLPELRKRIDAHAHRFHGH